MTPNEIEVKKQSVEALKKQLAPYLIITPRWRLTYFSKESAERGFVAKMQERLTKWVVLLELRIEFDDPNPVRYVVIASSD